MTSSADRTTAEHFDLIVRGGMVVDGTGLLAPAGRRRASATGGW